MTAAQESEASLPIRPSLDSHRLPVSRNQRAPPHGATVCRPLFLKRYSISTVCLGQSRIPKGPNARRLPG